MSRVLRPRRKQIRRTRLEHNVAAPPGRVVDQAPPVAGAGRVGCDQHVAGPDDESLAVAGGEFERAGERDDVLRLRGVVPVEGGMRRRFLEVRGDDIGALIELSVPSSTCEALSSPV
jgi:hypothetical protein